MFALPFAAAAFGFAFGFAVALAALAFARASNSLDFAKKNQHQRLSSFNVSVTASALFSPSFFAGTCMNFMWNIDDTTLKQKAAPKTISLTLSTIDPSVDASNSSSRASSAASDSSLAFNFLDFGGGFKALGLFFGVSCVTISSDNSKATYGCRIITTLSA